MTFPRILDFFSPENIPSFRVVVTRKLSEDGFHAVVHRCNEKTGEFEEVLPEDMTPREAKVRIKALDKVVKDLVIENACR